MGDGDKGKSTRGSPNISPISDSSSLSMRQSPSSTLGRLNSNLPVPKKTRKFWNRPSLGSQEQGSKLTHWDAYSGEPTTSEKGKPPSTTPGAVKLHADPHPGRLNGYGTSTHISAGNPVAGNSIGRKRVASHDLNHTPIVRPEWRGAGGRHKIINPLLDKPLPPGKSPNFPAGSGKYQQEQKERERIAEAMEKAQREHIEKKSMDKEHSEQRKEARQELGRSGERAAREQEKKVGENTMSSTTAQFEYPLRASESNHAPMLLNETRPDRCTTPPIKRAHDDMTLAVSGQDVPSRNPSLTAEGTKMPLTRNSSNADTRDVRLQILPELPRNTRAQDSPSPVQSTQKENLQAGSCFFPKEREDERNPRWIESRIRTDLHDLHLQNEPPSRFSATTYATTTCESPPTTPEMGSYSPSLSTTPSSILNRKRPLPPAGLPNPKVTARKPTPSHMSVTTQATPDSKRKSLPKSPPEVQAVSRVASLQAKLDNLRRRRGNLQTVIHELTHVVQPSSIAYDMASRQEIKRTVEGLNKELADVIKDEHETGLKLHRTMKRDDEFAAYEPTSIWVRRVTS